MRLDLGLLRFCAVLLASVSVPAAALAAPSGTLVIADNETPENLDPANASNSTVDELLIGAYDALVQFTAGETTVSPRLAKSWEISADGLTYTFHLRDDVLFHDGTKLTAADVKFTLDRLKAAAGNVLNDMGPYSSAEAVDDTTVKLSLSKPFGPFLPALSRIYIVNKKLVEPHMGDNHARQWLALNEAGSGPYMITSYNPTEAVGLKAFDKYWGGWQGNHVAEVVFRYITEPSTALSLLKSGEVQMAPKITVEDKVALQKEPGYIVDVGAAATPLFFEFNTAGKGPTGDAKFRQMLAQTFDRQLHLDQVLMGFGKLPDGPLPANWMGHAGGNEPAFNLDAAKKMVEENGWKGVTLTVRYLPAILEEKSAVEQLQSNLAELGITLKAEGTTWPAQYATVQKVETTSDINMIYAFPGFPDPHAILNTNFNGALAGHNGGFNFAQYSNPKVDSLLNQAAALTDQAKRIELYKEAQKLIGADYPVITVSNPASVVALSDKVVGYKYNVAHHQTYNYMDIGLKQ